MPIGYKPKFLDEWKQLTVAESPYWSWVSQLVDDPQATVGSLSVEFRFADARVAAEVERFLQLIDKPSMAEEIVDPLQATPKAKSAADQLVYGLKLWALASTQEGARNNADRARQLALYRAALKALRAVRQHFPRQATEGAYAQLAYALCLYDMKGITEAVYHELRVVRAKYRMCPAQVFVAQYYLATFRFDQHQWSAAKHELLTLVHAHARFSRWRFYFLARSNLRRLGA